MDIPILPQIELPIPRITYSEDFNRELDRLRQERDIFRCRGYLLAGAAPNVTYAIIRRHASEHLVVLACRVLGDSGVGCHAHKRHGSPAGPVLDAPDLIGREFSTAAPDHRWCTNVKQVWTCEGSLHFDAVIHLRIRRVVGHAFGPFRTSLQVLGAVRSQSRPGTPLDNAVIENVSRPSCASSPPLNTSRLVPRPGHRSSSTSRSYTTASVGARRWATSAQRGSNGGIHTRRCPPKRGRLKPKAKSALNEPPCSASRRAPLSEAGPQK